MKIEHRFHKHPLMFVELQLNQTEKPRHCSGCREVVISANSSYSCVDCNYHLHKECAQAPCEIAHLPLHTQHSSFTLRQSPRTMSWYVCALCKQKRDMFFFECDDCWFALDIKCFLLLLKNAGESIYEFKDGDYSHLHPFIFLENHKDELKNVDCSWCHQSLLYFIYVSVDCKLRLHKRCLDNLPSEINFHPCHRLHPLILQFHETNCFCKVCKKEDGNNFFYRCLACKFDIHLECIWPRLIIEEKKYHVHPFTLYFRNDSFICDACGTDGEFVSYICLTCHIQVHKNCTSLPHAIKVTRHDHVVYHKYFFKKAGEFDQKHRCGICFNEVKPEHGRYQCLTLGCNYIVHVNCATQDENLYHISDDQDDEELIGGTDKVAESITRDVEMDFLGKTIQVKLKHFNHEHNLAFEEIKEDNMDKKCDGCMLSVSSPFYKCLEYCSNFFLHINCGNLPILEHHWFHRFPATLQAHGCLVCNLCNRLCSGLFYRSSNQGERFYFCLRCARVPNFFKSQGHDHFLFFDNKFKGKCNACGVSHSFGAFICKECSFSLDFACMTLPEAIQHKCDGHLLKLAYDVEDDDDDHFCHVCEEERDPKLWYYHCSICDKDVHTKCGLGKYPFLKDGTSWPLCHIHEVSFVRKVIDDYPYCFDCGELCLEEVLKCATCDFIVHCECSSSIRLRVSWSAEKTIFNRLLYDFL